MKVTKTRKKTSSKTGLKWGFWASKYISGTLKCWNLAPAA